MLKILKGDYSLIFLIISNLIPIFGILFLKWDIFYMLFYYWLESAVIGFFTIIKMATAQGTPQGTIPKNLNAKSEKYTRITLKSFLIPFFILHFGAFMFVHLVFIIAIALTGNNLANTAAFSFHIGLNSTSNSLNSTGINPQEIKEVLSTILKVFLFSVFLLLSHGISFFTNFIGKKEYKETDVTKVMSSPYSRVIIMQMVIVIGAFILALTKAPIMIGILFIGIKTFFDVKAHIKEHSKLPEKPVLNKKNYFISSLNKGQFKT